MRGTKPHENLKKFTGVAGGFTSIVFGDSQECRGLSLYGEAGLLMCPERGHQTAL